MKDKIILAATVLLFIFCTASCNNTTTDQHNKDVPDTMATMPAASLTGRDSGRGITPSAMADTSVRKGTDSMPLH